MGFRRKCAEASRCGGKRGFESSMATFCAASEHQRKRLLQIKLCLDFHFICPPPQWFTMAADDEAGRTLSQRRVDLPCWMGGKVFASQYEASLKVKRSLWGWWGVDEVRGPVREANSGCLVFFCSFSLISVGELRGAWWVLIDCERSRRWAAHPSSLTSCRFPAFNVPWSFVWCESSVDRRTHPWRIYSNQ